MSRQQAAGGDQDPAETSGGGQEAAGDGEQDSAGTSAEEQEEGRSIAEWTSLVVSVAIVVALVGLVSYEHVAGPTRPPTIDARPRLDAARTAGGEYYLPIDITNRGNLTAESVRIRVSLATDQGRQETAEVSVQFLAGGATARGTAVFREDPSRGQVAVNVLSLQEP
jgi:uncharacterized protein (TIGR02588 family)